MLVDTWGKARCTHHIPSTTTHFTHFCYILVTFWELELLLLLAHVAIKFLRVFMAVLSLSLCHLSKSLLSLLLLFSACISWPFGQNYMRGEGWKGQRSATTRSRSETRCDSWNELEKQLFSVISVCWRVKKLFILSAERRIAVWPSSENLSSLLTKKIGGNVVKLQ